MATYVGYTVGGVPGAIVATIGEVTPSIIVILIVAAMLAKFRDSQYVANAFYGLRPASTGLIGAACAGVMLQAPIGAALFLCLWYMRNSRKRSGLYVGISGMNME